MKIFCHFKKAGADVGENVELEFEAFPSIGDHVATNTTSPWYRVVHVVHTPFEGKKLAGELYAVEVDHMEVLKKWG